MLELLQFYTVPDMDVACSIKWACGIYASSVLLKKNFAVFTGRGRGIYVEEIEQCLRQHEHDMERIKLSQIKLRDACNHSQLARDTDYLFVFSEHMCVYRNGYVNERCRGGWVNPLLKESDVKNRRIDEIYKIYKM